MDDERAREAAGSGGGWPSGPEGTWLLDAAATQPSSGSGEPPAGAEASPAEAPEQAGEAPVAAAEAPTVAMAGVGAAAATPARHLEVRDEAFPEVAPPEPEDPTGSVPAISAQRRWARAQVANWRLFLVRFACAGLAVIAAVVIVPGISFTSWRWGQFMQIAIIFGLLNATLKPLLQFLVLRFIFNTYGVVVVVINAILLGILASLMGDKLVATGALPVLFGGLAVGAFGLLFETLLGANPPVLDRDYKERNGLK